MENVRTKFNELLTKIAESVKTFWHNVNTPNVRTTFNDQSARKRLENNLILMIITFASMSLVCITSYFQEDYKDKIFLIATGILGLGILSWLSNYRRAIAISKAARVRFIRNTRQTFRRVVRRTSRCLNRMLRLIIGMLVISLLILLIPEVEEYAPSAVEAARTIVEFFNDCIAKAITYINSYLA